MSEYRDMGKCEQAMDTITNIINTHGFKDFLGMCAEICDEAQILYPDSPEGKKWLARSKALSALSDLS
jgi:hypothetical protein